MKKIVNERKRYGSSMNSLPTNNAILIHFVCSEWKVTMKHFETARYEGSYFPSNFYLPNEMNIFYSQYDTKKYD